MLMELVETERSYVRRLDVLYNRYAQPLRQLARHRDSAIIPLYEAQRLFGNVGELLGANTAFLREMDLLLQQGGGRLDALKANIGSLAHNHVSSAGETFKHPCWLGLLTLMTMAALLSAIDGMLFLLQRVLQQLREGEAHRADNEQI